MRTAIPLAAWFCAALTLSAPAGLLIATAGGWRYEAGVQDRRP